MHEWLIYNLALYRVGDLEEAHVSCLVHELFTFQLICTICQINPTKHCTMSLWYGKSIMNLP